MIAEDIVRRIQTELDRIEADHDVVILFACESGSRAWGFPSPDSDYDVRMVYVHPADWYLDLERRRDVIEEPITDELDVAGWDLDKTLRLLRKSNPNILEWVGSPIIYREKPAFSHVRALLTASFDHRASILHYLNMALNNKRQWLDRDQIKIKKYLYTLRPLLCGQWVIKHGSQPPMLYHELLADLHPGSGIDQAIRELVRRKLDLKELDLVPRDPFLTEWIGDALDELRAAIPDKPGSPAWAPYNAAFRTILASA